MLNNLKRNKKGFTLIELIIVVAIIAILAAIAIPNFMNARQEAKWGVIYSDASAVAQVMNAYNAMQSSESAFLTTGDAADYAKVEGDLTNIDVDKFTALCSLSDRANNDLLVCANSMWYINSKFDKNAATIPEDYGGPAPATN